MISHWDDARTWRAEKGHIAATWSSLTGRESRTVGLKRIRVDPGSWSTPLHLEGAEEEIFYVLGGSGVSVQWGEGDDEPVGYEVREGDCLVHRALESAHTLQAGPDGIDVLAFGQRAYANGITWLPRASVAWLGKTWASVGAEADHPWAREAAVGPPEIGELSERPPSIVNAEDVEVVERETATIGRRIRDLGRAAGSIRTGLRLSEISPGKLGSPPHCHSAEEEIFVVLEGDGHLLLWEREGVVEHEVRAGSVVVRVAGTGVAHAFRGGASGLTLLLYGTRDSNDVCFYPRSGKVMFRGIGLVTRLGGPVDYWDGED
ncbi:MAG: hypothetical protein KatS3mg012_1936 [Gaiellaceae bacterium]|nr:MAG: hypothetical protein KatS3mg012_1936 [Gaiellaceae bacterium]